MNEKYSGCTTFGYTFDKCFWLYLLERLDKNCSFGNDFNPLHCVLLLQVMGENVWNLLLLHSTSMYMTMCVCLSDCQSVWLLYAQLFQFQTKFCIYENIDTLSPLSAFFGIQFNSTYHTCAIITCCWSETTNTNTIHT